MQAAAELSDQIFQEVIFYVQGLSITMGRKDAWVSSCSSTFSAPLWVASKLLDLSVLVQFFPTIEYSDWRKNPRLAPLLPLDAAGNADDRSVLDFFAMLRELQARSNEACRDLGKNPPGSKDTLFDAYLWAMKRVGDHHFHLMDPSVNQWDAWADTAFWQARMRCLAANCRIYSSQGSTLNRILKASEGHPVVLKFETWLLGQLLSNQQDESETATDQTMDLVAQVTHPHQVTRKWDAASCNLAMGLRGGKQINPQEPIAVMDCERDRWAFAFVSMSSIHFHH